MAGALQSGRAATGEGWRTMVSTTPEVRVVLPLLAATWSRQTFVHWPVDPARVRRLLPDGLEPDIWEGTAWLSFTPFVMEKVRCAGLVPLPPAPTFPETNLRTYVRGPDGRDGLWFFSLEATNPLVVATARGMIGVPYHRAVARVTEDAGTVCYSGTRHGGGPSYRLRVRPGAPLDVTPRDVWLTGRWQAYSRRWGTLWRTPLVHEPWPLRTATLEAMEDGLTAAAGLPSPTAPPLVHYAERVRMVRLGLSRPVPAGPVRS